MKKYNGVTTLSAVLLALSLTACQDDTRKTFVVEGTVSGGAGEMLFLEEVGTGNILSLDSVKLDEKGAFSFHHKGTNYPMYYSLRLGEASIPFVADSLTHIKLETQAKAFFTAYRLTEADPFNHQIREIATLRYRTERSVDSIVQRYEAGALTPAEQQFAIDSIQKSFKSYLASHFIYVDPKSPAAYFALYQRKGDVPYFSIYEEGDDRAFAAVATAYELYYPEAPYLSFLKDEALKAIAIRRMRRGESAELASPDSLKQ